MGCENNQALSRQLVAHSVLAGLGAGEVYPLIEVDDVEATATVDVIFLPVLCVDGVLDKALRSNPVVPLGRLPLIVSSPEPPLSLLCPRR